MAVPLQPPTSKVDIDVLSLIVPLLLVCGALVCGHGMGIVAAHLMDVSAVAIFCLFAAVALVMLVKELVYPSPVVHYIHHIHNYPPPPYSVREAAARISCPN